MNKPSHFACTHVDNKMLIFTVFLQKAMNAWNGRRGLASNLFWSQNTPAKGISMATTETNLDSPRLDEQWDLEVKEAPFSPAWLHFLLNFYIIAGDRLIITHCYASGNSIQPVEGQPFLPCWSKKNSDWRKQTPIIILVQFCFIFCALSKYWRQCTCCLGTC